MDLGLIESQTRPVKILVTANPKVNRSALDCELPASATGAMPERARLRRTARREAAPT